MTPAACTACGAAVPGPPEETCRDAVFGREFRLYRCPACGVVFTEPPPDFPLQAWYETERHLYEELEYSVRPEAGEDWRFRRFLRCAEVRGLSGRLLDVGCGDGRFLAEARRQGWRGELEGLDFSAGMAGRAPEGTRISVAPLEEFARGARARPYDAAVVFDVLEHFPRPREAVEHLRSLVKPGGHLAVTMPNAARPRLFVREEFDYPPNHYTRWDAPALRSLLERGGFEPMEVESSPLQPAAFSEQLYYRLVDAMLPWVKRAWGGRSGEGRTLGELAAAGSSAASRVLADKGRRHRLKASLKGAFNLTAWPVLWPFCRLASILRPGRGDILFVLARRT